MPARQAREINRTFRTFFKLYIPLRVNNKKEGDKVGDK